MVGRELALAVLLVEGLLPRCLYTRMGLCMSRGGGESHGVDIPKTRGRGGVAQYQPFKKGTMQGHNVFPIDELDRERVGR